MPGNEAKEGGPVARTFGPAPTEEGGVRHKVSPLLARQGATEEGGSVVNSHEDLRDEVVGERSQCRGAGRLAPLLPHVSRYYTSVLVHAVAGGTLQIGSWVGGSYTSQVTYIYSFLVFFSSSVYLDSYSDVIMMLVHLFLYWPW
jgi:hypothetical protein